MLRWYPEESLEQTTREWIEENLQIRDETPEIVPLLYTEQQAQLDRLARQQESQGKPVRIIGLKPRKGRFSTWVEAEIYARLRRRPNQAAMIVAHDGQGSNTLYEMFQRFCQFDPHQLETTKNNQHRLIFAPPHSSQITVATAGTDTVGSSQTNHAVHISEFAKWPRGTEEAAFLSLMGTIPKHHPDTFAAIESTANGAVGLFWEMWKDAIAGKGIWLPYFFGWWEVKHYRLPVGSVSLEGLGENPRYNGYEQEEIVLQERYDCDLEQLVWRRYVIDENCKGDVQEFWQEFPTTWQQAFLASGRPKFNQLVLERWEALAQPPIWRGDCLMDGGMPRLIEGPHYHEQIWEMPVGGEQYAAGADVAKGYLYGDFNSAAFLSKGLRGPRRLVAKIRAKFGGLESDEYALRLDAVGRLYNTALLVIERNEYGLAVIEETLKLRYPTGRLFHDVTVGKEVKELSQKIGWWTSRTEGGGGTKPILIDGIVQAIRDEIYEIRDPEMIAALKSCVVHDNRTVGDASGHTPDDVMGLGMAIQGVGYGGGGFQRHWSKANLREVEE
mgnify:FL=1